MLGPIHHDPTDLIIHGNRQYFVDDVRHVVAWNGKNLIPHTRYRKLRFFLHKASIYLSQMLDPAAVPRQQLETGMGWDMGQVPAS